MTQIQKTSELERLVAVETKLDIVINNQQKQSESIDRLLANFVSKDEHEKDVADLEDMIEESSRRGKLQSAITGGLSAVFTLILTLLVQNYMGQ